jgi:hypothetical protein
MMGCELLRAGILVAQTTLPSRDQFNGGRELADTPVPSPRQPAIV